MKVLVTGGAGFIAFHVTQRLLNRGDQVVGIDNLNDYYDPNLKQARLDELMAISEKVSGEFSFLKIDIADRAAMDELFKEHQFDGVINLAAQAGVRYSLENPHAYAESNIMGFLNVLEGCRHSEVGHLVYASTSSVYGANTKVPFSEHDMADHPLQFYAATKRANELMAHSYSHLYQLPTTGLRFFTVYGPWGRPDMALFMFTKNIIDEKPIKVFNHGNHTRDFTYVEDIADGVVAALDRTSTPDPRWRADSPDASMSAGPYRVFNIGNNSPVKLGEYIEAIEEVVGKKAIKDLLPLQPGDVLDTYADVTEFKEHVGYSPNVGVQKGVRNFVNWYREHYQH
jgi:UDP-glucuronate 4-epimerase